MEHSFENYFSNLFDFFPFPINQEIFTSLSTVNDDLYFMCNVEDFKELVKMVHHVVLPLRTRYVYCCAPVNLKQPFVCAMFTKVNILVRFENTSHEWIYYN